MGEYARASTTAASAYVRPLVRGYLRSLEGRVRELAGEAAVSLVTSSGHVTPLETAVEAPIRLLESDAISMLTRTNPARRSYENQLRRDGDELNLYANAVGTWQVSWGENAQ